MKIIIYKITILTTGKSYIGETNNLVRRISQHKHSAKNKCCNRKGMYLDWIAGGINNFSVEILDEFEFKSKADTWDREGEYISKYNTATTIQRIVVAVLCLIRQKIESGSFHIQ